MAKPIPSKPALSLVDTRTAQAASSEYSSRLSEIDDLLARDDLSESQRSNLLEQRASLEASWSELQSTSLKPSQAWRADEAVGEFNSAADHIESGVDLIEREIESQADAGSPYVANHVRHGLEYNGPQQEPSVEERSQNGQAGGGGDVGGHDTNYYIENPAEALEYYRQDRGAFAQMLRDADPSDRQLLMQGIQEQLQSENQVFTALSNLMSADHTTTKAIANNLRV